MSVNGKRALGRFVIFALLGLLFEVFFTSAAALRSGNLNMHGQTSPWMMFDYGLLGLVLMPIARPMIRRSVPLVARAVVYMIGIFAVEFASGWVFEVCGLRIWGYEHLPWNLYGYITAVYIPLWYVLGLAAEFLYHKIDMVSLALVRGLTAKQIEAFDVIAATATPTTPDSA